MKAAADSRWGNAGENGGHLTLRASNQALSGNIVADSISTIALDMTTGSSPVSYTHLDVYKRQVLFIFHICIGEQDIFLTFRRNS